MRPAHGRGAPSQLYHEATIANLLEVVCYYDYAVAAMGDALIDLADYCVRKVNYLVSKWVVALLGARPPRDGRPSREGVCGAGAQAAGGACVGAGAGGGQGRGVCACAPAAGALRACVLRSLRGRGRRGCAQDLDQQRSEITFRTAVAAVTILRYLTEHVSKLPLGIITRLLDTHGARASVSVSARACARACVARVACDGAGAQTCCCRLCRSLKTRRGRDGCLAASGKNGWTGSGAQCVAQRRACGARRGVRTCVVGGAWPQVAQIDLLQLTQLEGQVWLSIYNLLVRALAAWALRDRRMALWNGAGADAVRQGVPHEVPHALLPQGHRHEGERRAARLLGPRGVGVCDRRRRHARRCEST